MSDDVEQVSGGELEMGGPLLDPRKHCVHVLMTTRRSQESKQVSMTHVLHYHVYWSCRKYTYIHMYIQKSHWNGAKKFDKRFNLQLIVAKLVGPVHALVCSLPTVQTLSSLTTFG